MADKTEKRTPVQSPMAIPSPVQSLPERRRRLPRWAVVLLVIALVAVVGLLVRLAYDHELWGGKTVPAVVGMSEQDATQALEDLGFAVEVEYASADEEFDVVLSCTPEPGTRVDPAQGATITVSAERLVPRVVGLSQEEAEQALLDAGAAGVEVTYKSSDSVAGTVLAVSPGVGEPFVSTNKITITVAQPFKVPDVRGLTLDEARSAIEEAGLASSVSYVESDADKNTVVETSPAAGEEVSSDATVELSVSDPFPSEPFSLLEYFEAQPEQISEYLADEEFAVERGSIYISNGHADAVYRGKAGDVIQFSDDPETSSTGGDSGGDVLAQGAEIGGVRYAFSAKTVPDGATVESEEGVRTVMKACGLKGLEDTCTQDDVSLPKDLLDEEELEDAHFICATGRQDGYVWVVYIGGMGESTKVVAMAAPASHFDGLDTSGFGGLADYVAGIDLAR